MTMDELESRRVKDEMRDLVRNNPLPEPNPHLNRLIANSSV